MDYAVQMVFAIYVVVPQKNIHNIYGLSRSKKFSPNELIQQGIAPEDVLPCQGMECR